MVINLKLLIQITSISLYNSGNFPGNPKTHPTRESFLVNDGSINKPTPISPPGTAYTNSFSSANNETTRVKRGVQVVRLPYFYGLPGLISTSSPTLNTPERIDPPTTPPFNFSGFSPGLLTSNDLNTINNYLIIIILGGTLSYLSGIGKN